MGPRRAVIERVLPQSSVLLVPLAQISWTERTTLPCIVRVQKSARSGGVIRRASADRLGSFEGRDDARKMLADRDALKEIVWPHYARQFRVIARLIAVWLSCVHRSVVRKKSARMRGAVLENQT